MAGIGTEDELPQLLEADAGEEVAMGDVVGHMHQTGQDYKEERDAAQYNDAQIDDSYDSIFSWGDDA